MALLLNDFGHGKNTYPPSKGVPGLPEFEFNSAVGKETKQLLQGKVSTYEAQPFNGNDVLLRTRTDRYNAQWRKDKTAIGISSHANANSKPSVRGFGVFYWHSSPEAKKLAEILLDEYKKEFPDRDQYPIWGTGLFPSKPGTWTELHMCRETEGIFVLVEWEFMTNPDALKLLKSNDYRKRCALVKAKSVCRWYGIKYNGVEDEKETNTGKKDVSHKDFLTFIEPGAIAGWKKYGILPSISGAQAILESGWGQSTLAVEANNLFGIKAGSGWRGNKRKYPTKEQDKNGNECTVDAYFRVYDSWADSVEDHGSFFTSTDWRKKNYAAVIGEKDYVKQAKEIQKAGYATDVEYADKLIRIIKENNLNDWDKKAEVSVSQKEKTNDDSYIGCRVESIYSGKEGLNFYSKASWNKKYKAGVLQKGYGFPTIIDKVKVDDAFMYKVKNSKGAVYYVTASSKYVKVEGQSKAVSKPKPAPKPKKQSGIPIAGYIKIVNVANAAFIYDRPSGTKSKNLATAKKGTTWPISGSVPGWYEVIYKGRRAYVNAKYGKRV